MRGFGASGQRSQSRRRERGCLPWWARHPSCIAPGRARVSGLRALPDPVSQAATLSGETERPSSTPSARSGSAPNLVRIRPRNTCSSRPELPNQALRRCGRSGSWRTLRLAAGRSVQRSASRRSSCPLSRRLRGKHVVEGNRDQIAENNHDENDRNRDMACREFARDH